MIYVNDMNIDMNIAEELKVYVKKYNSKIIDDMHIESYFQTVYVICGTSYVLPICIY